jgi:hypothetical protein
VCLGCQDSDVLAPMYSTPATAEWGSHPRHQFTEVRRDADVSVEYKGTIKSRLCTGLPGTNTNSSAPTCTHVWLTRRSSVNVHSLQCRGSLRALSTQVTRGGSLKKGLLQTTQFNNLALVLPRRHIVLVPAVDRSRSLETARRDRLALLFHPSSRPLDI